VHKKTNIQKSHTYFEAQCAKKQIFTKAMHTLKGCAQKNKCSKKPRTLRSTVCKKSNIQKSHANLEAQCAKNKCSKKPRILRSTLRKKTNIQKSHAHFEAHCAKNQIFRKAMHTLKHSAQKNKYS